MYQQSPDSWGWLGIHTRAWLLAGSSRVSLPPSRYRFWSRAAADPQPFATGSCKWTGPCHLVPRVCPLLFRWWLPNVVTLCARWGDNCVDRWQHALRGCKSKRQAGPSVNMCPSVDAIRLQAAVDSPGLRGLAVPSQRNIDAYVV